ncbi:hypothetical protein BGX33_002552 [Mortierella sp. NVP41]|nr:hypothetical protein BGX33_002552 [Mortierella sp. NVP41]
MIKITTFLLVSLSISLFSLSEAKPGECFLHVPKHPLTAKGLATPYILKKGSCDQTISDQQVFVEATVFDLDTKTFSVYHPLVINEGTKPAIAPVVPKLPKNSIVGLWFGANSDSITLTGDIKNCVNGLSNKDIFGQVAFCNAGKFFQAVRAANNSGAAVAIPPLGEDVNGNPCPTTRHFGIIDQDQSDNVITTYLRHGKRFAQATAKNRKKLKKYVEIANGSDNALVAALIDPAIKCMPFKAPSLMEHGVHLGSMALNELHASLQPAPVALVPVTNPMVLSHSKISIPKVNAYRKGVNQPLISHLSQATVKSYCTHYDKIAPTYIRSIAKYLIVRPSPDTGAASNLLTFLGQRYAGSWTNLHCDMILNKPSDITVTTNNKGVATKIHIHRSKPIKK